MNELVLTGSIAALGAGAVTGVGSLPIYFVSHITQRVKAGFFGFASGIMLAASFFSLLIPGIEQRANFLGIKGRRCWSSSDWIPFWRFFRALVLTVTAS